LKLSDNESFEILIFSNVPKGQLNSAQRQRLGIN
jgi:hypothetical protein